MSTLPTSLPNCNNPLFLTRQSLPRRPSYSPPATFSDAYPRRSFAIRSSAGEQRPSNSQHLIPTLATSAALIFFNLGGFRSFAAASVRLPPAVVIAEEDRVVNNQATEGNAHVEECENEEAKAAFERYKSKTYALTVPLRIVALRNSVPPLWIKNFVQSQGKRVKFRLEFRGNLEKMFSELSTAIGNGKLTSKSVGAADIISLGDTWVNFAISQMLIEPIQGVEEQDWFHKLSDKWKVYLHRNNEGKLDTEGKIWAVPYRWGSMVIAYRKNKFRQHNLAPVEDWADLWRSDLAGRISMVDSPREVIGAVLKYMGASYNTSNIDSQVVGGRHAVRSELAALKKQVRLFDSANHLKAFSVGDVWVAVGWSSDIIPAAKRMSDVAVIVPKSGASLWADLWAIPAASRVETGRVGGRVRGPSPLVHQWMEFCLQSQRVLPFEEEVVAGASPAALGGRPAARKPETAGPNKPKLDTNLVSGVPPPEILTRAMDRGKRKVIDSDIINKHAHMSSHLNVEMINDLKHYLSDSQYVLFRDDVFGEYLRLPLPILIQYQVIRALMVHEVIDRTTKDRFVVKLNNSLLSFDLTQFAIVTGLRCFGDETCDVDDSFSSNLQGVYFEGSQNVSKQKLKEVFLGKKWKNDDDAVKIAILYFLNFFLLPNSSNYIFGEHFFLIESGKYRAYPWGKVVFGELLSQISGKTKNKQFYKLGGFLIAFQAWFYECCAKKPSTFCVKTGQHVPRILNWKFTTAPTYKTVEDLILPTGSKKIQFVTISPSEEEISRLRLTELHSSPVDIPHGQRELPSRVDSDDDFKSPPTKIPRVETKGKQSETRKKAKVDSQKHVVDFESVLTEKVQKIEKDLNLFKEDFSAFKISTNESFQKVFERFDDLSKMISSSKPVKHGHDDIDDDEMHVHDDMHDDDVEKDDKGANSCDEVNDEERRSGADEDVNPAMNVDAAVQDDKEDDGSDEHKDEQPGSQIVVYTGQQEDVLSPVPIRRVRQPSRFRKSPFVKMDSGDSSSKAKKNVFDLKHPFVLDPSFAINTDLEDQFHIWLNKGARKSAKYKNDPYSAKNDILEEPFDFGFTTIGRKKFFHDLLYVGTPLSDLHMDVMFYYLRKLGKYSQLEMKFTTTDALFQQNLQHLHSTLKQKGNWTTSDIPRDHTLVDYVQGYKMFANTPWHLVDFVLIPINVEAAFHWVLGVLSFRERCIFVWDSLDGTASKNPAVKKAIGSFCEVIPHLLLIADWYGKRKLVDKRGDSFEESTEHLVQKRCTSIPTQLQMDCGAFTIAYAEYWVNGMDIRTADFNIDFYRSRIATLLWDYGRKKQRSNAVSESEKTGSFFKRTGGSVIDV